MGALIHAQFASLVGVRYHDNWLVILYLTHSSEFQRCILYKQNFEHSMIIYTR